MSLPKLDTKTRAHPKFDRTMNVEQLIRWLDARGVGELDRERIEEQGFTGESFLLLDDETVKEIGVKTGGRMLLKRLVAEAKATCDSSENSVAAQNLTSITSGPPAASNPTMPSVTVTNDLSNNLGDVGSSTRNPIRQNSSTTPSTEINNPFTTSDSGGQNNTTRSTVIQNQLSTNDPSDSGGQNDDVEREEPTSQEASSDVSQAQAIDTTSEDNFRQEETPVYCTTGPYGGASVFSYDHSIYMYRDKVWAGRQVLRVFFLNSGVLTGWGLDVDTILEWAAVWRQTDDDRIPLFQKCTTSKKADIRVMFSETEGCWSAVGMDAEKIVTQDKPTMMLNLKDLTQEFQKSLVIHEFGHALGLDHEHQRSDFWDVLEKFFDKSRIPNSQTIRVKKTDDMMDREEASCRYDSESIMHYWFDAQWLKPVYQDVETVVRMVGLSGPERSYLIGLHQRQGEDLLPSQPSNTDFEQLSKAYADPGPREVSNIRPAPMGSHRLAVSQSVDVAPTSPRREIPRMGSSFDSQRGEIPPVSRMGSSFSESQRGEIPPVSVMGSSFESQGDVVVLNSEYHLRAIRNALWEVRTKWREIGRELRLSQYDLDTLNGNTGDNLDKVLLLWMHRGGATIDQLLDVLRSARVNREDLANAIEMTRDTRKRKELGLL